jgi:hypothetical protein
MQFDMATCQAFAQRGRPALGCRPLHSLVPARFSSSHAAHASIQGSDSGSKKYLALLEAAYAGDDCAPVLTSVRTCGDAATAGTQRERVTSVRKLRSDVLNALSKDDVGATLELVDRCALRAG